MSAKYGARKSLGDVTGYPPSDIVLPSWLHGYRRNGANRVESGKDCRQQQPLIDSNPSYFGPMAT